ncbi:MAG: cupin domain-containing protein [Candidatus Krumholzibacteriia bacterium]
MEMTRSGRLVPPANDRAPSGLSDLLPSEILALPKVEVPVSGATGFSLADDEKQVVFFVFDEGVSFPDHAHCEQRGVVVSGEMVLEIEGATNLYQAGDRYVVPENVHHRTTFTQQTVLIDMSDATDRFPVRR